MRSACCITIAVRYVLEMCEAAAEAASVLARPPVQLAYNLALLNRSGNHLTVFVAPVRPARVERVRATTNHQDGIDWREYAAVTRSVELLERLHRLLDRPAVARGRFVQAFLRPPLHGARYAAGFGTLYTASYTPARGEAEYPLVPVFLAPVARPLRGGRTRGGSPRRARARRARLAARVAAPTPRRCARARESRRRCSPSA